MRKIFPWLIPSLVALPYSAVAMHNPVAVDDNLTAVIGTPLQINVKHLLSNDFDQSNKRMGRL